MTHSPRHAKASRAARRPALRAALVLPTALGLVLVTSAGAGALAAVGRLVPTGPASPASASPIAGRVVEITDVVTVPDPSGSASPSAEARDGQGGAAAAEPAADDDEPGTTATAQAAGAGVAGTPSPAADATVEPSAATAASTAPEGVAPTANMTVAVKNPGATYVSSSSTDRPMLMFSGWEDEAGQPLGAGGTVATPVQVRIVDAAGAAQSATIYPEFTNGRSDYTLPLWPFTQAMEPHVGTYTVEWRLPGADEWQVIDTMTMDVRLPEATADSTLSYSGGILTGTGWAFDRSTNIGGSFNVALDVTDTQGNTTAVMVRARFVGNQFTVTDAALAASGVSIGGGYTISATPTGGEAGAVSVKIPGDGGAPEPTTQPTAPEPTDAPTSAPASPQTEEPSANPEPSAPPATPGAAEPTAPESTASGSATASGTSAAPRTGDGQAAPKTEDPNPAEPTSAPTTVVVTPTEAGPTASPQASSTTSGTGSRQAGPGATVFETFNEGVEVDPLIVRDTNNGRGGITASTAATQQGNTQAAPETDAGQSKEEGDSASRPAHAPTSPVKDAGELGPDNAGSLSGTRQGTTITLIFPSAKVKAGDWVAVFVFPGATTPGWVQVDAENSVSIDISTLEPGSYKIAVGDRNSQLLGWAQLEIAQTASQGADGTGITLITGDALASGGMLGADGWKLVGAGALLILGAASFFVLARPALVGSRARIHRR